ncbi:hypothetical protein FACS18945_4080 [Bacteroidia bacterium]|nr:hypothetical protein FACS18945_4080 [Bacteroidia bacterium]
MCMRIKEIVVVIISTCSILFAGFLIGKSCESYCATCNGYVLFPIASIIGLPLLIFGLWLLIKFVQNKKHKKYLFIFLFLYGLLLFAFGTYISYKSYNVLLEMYGGYQEGIIIENSSINDVILFFTSLILCFYSILKLRER